VHLGLNLRVLVQLLGAKMVIWVDLSLKHNSFSNTNEHSNALLVVVTFLLVQTQYAITDPGTGTQNT